MRSVFIGKIAAQWLMNKIEHIVVGENSKQFFTFRDGDVAYTLQQSTKALFGWRSGKMGGWKIMGG